MTTALRAAFAPTPGRNVTLDCLRGIAAYLVVLHHLHLPVIEALPIDFGKFGIMMFFIISGYIIPSSFSDASTKLDGAADFVIKRFFRLYPAYWASMILALTSPMFFAAPPSTGTIAANATMLQMMLGFTNLILVYWTLQFELIFYAICFVLFLTGQLFRKRTAVTGLILLLALALSMAVARAMLDRALPVALPISLSAMFFGATLRRCRDEPASRLTLYTLGYLLAVSAISAIAYWSPVGPADPTPWYSYVTGYSAAILMFYVFMTRTSLNSTFLFYIGAISYSVYLVHIVCLSWLDYLAPSLRGAGFGGELLRTLGLFALTTLISTIFYLVIERPTIRLGRTLARRISFSGGAAKQSV